MSQRRYCFVPGFGCDHLEIRAMLDGDGVDPEIQTMCDGAAAAMVGEPIATATVDIFRTVHLIGKM